MRRTLAAGISVFFAEWSASLPGARSTKRHGLGLFEYRLRFDERSMALRTRHGRVAGCAVPAVARSARPGACGAGHALLHTFFHRDRESITLLSGGISASGRPSRWESTPGLGDARWRLRELQAEERTTGMPVPRLVRCGFEPTSDQPRDSVASGTSGGALQERRAAHIDFARVYERVAREAQAEGPLAIRQLRALEDRYRLALAVRTRRIEARLTQEQLGEACGVPRREIGRIESGEANPTLLTIGSLARALGGELRVGRPDPA